MAKTLIAFYSHTGENYVDGSVRFLKRGNNEVTTFLEAHDWSGKTVIPFTTQEGSGWGRGLGDLKAAIPSAHVKKGLSIQGSKVATAGRQIETFVNGDK